jgi:hypothetical protein
MSLISKEKRWISIIQRIKKVRLHREFAFLLAKQPVLVMSGFITGLVLVSSLKLFWLLRSFGEKGRDRKSNERNTWVSEEAKILFHLNCARARIN